MKTQSLLAQALGMFTNRQAVAKRRKGTMKLVKALMVVAALGIGTQAQANGYVSILSDQISGVSVGAGYITLGTTEALTMCGTAQTIRIDVTSPLHDRAFVMFTTAHVIGQDLLIWVQCGGTDNNIPYAIEVNMYKPGTL